MPFSDASHGSIFGLPNGQLAIDFEQRPPTVHGVKLRIRNGSRERQRNADTLPSGGVPNFCCSIRGDEQAGAIVGRLCAGDVLATEPNVGQLR